MDVIKKDVVFPDVPHTGRMGLHLHNLAGERILQEYSNTPWSEIWRVTRNQWSRTVDAYEANPADFYAAWHYLDQHPAFWCFKRGTSDADPLPLEERLHVKNLEHEGGIDRCVSITVAKVNAITGSTEDEPADQTEIWIELGKQSWPVEHDPKDASTYDTVFGDYMLDCGGPTMETAFLRAAHNVWQVYGNDRRVCDAPFDKMAYVTVVDSDYFEELMREHGDDGEINKAVQAAARRLHQIIENHAKMLPKQIHATAAIPQEGGGQR